MLHPDNAQFLRQRPAAQDSAAARYASASAFLVFFAAAFAIPYLAPQLTGVTSSALLYLLLGSGLALEIWLAGVPDFAFMVWFAIGAGCEMMMVRIFALPFWICLPVGMILAAVTAVFLVSPLLRLRREHVAVITLAFGAAVPILWSQSGIVLPVVTVPATAAYYPSVVAAAALATLLSWRIRRSPLALMLRAGGEDETACRAVGVDLRKCRIIIVAIGAMIAGAAGGLFAAGQGILRPADFDISAMAVLLAIAVFGGRRSQSGIIFAAILAAALWQLFTDAPVLRLLITGAALLCWPLLRNMANSARRDLTARDSSQTETAIEAAE